MIVTKIIFENWKRQITTLGILKSLEWSLEFYRDYKKVI